MKCADPVLCYTDSKGNKKYRHFSLASHIHKLSHQQVFNCGKCLFCRKKKSYELASRCVLHASLYTDNCFLTLTYDEKQKGYHNVLDYTDIQKFKKRLESTAILRKSKSSTSTSTERTEKSTGISLSSTTTSKTNNCLLCQIASLSSAQRRSLVFGPIRSPKYQLVTALLEKYRQHPLCTRHSTWKKT